MSFQNERDIELSNVLTKQYGTKESLHKLIKDRFPEYLQTGICLFMEDDDHCDFAQNCPAGKYYYGQLPAVADNYKLNRPNMTAEEYFLVMLSWYFDCLEIDNK